MSKWNCPYEVFAEWMSDASKKVDEYNAMTIASVNKQVSFGIIDYEARQIWLAVMLSPYSKLFQGYPSARMVLLKEVKADQGFIFFTNYGSRKVSGVK